MIFELGCDDRKMIAETICVDIGRIAGTDVLADSRKIAF
jgi:hypothetical protein